MFYFCPMPKWILTIVLFIVSISLHAQRKDSLRALYYFDLFQRFEYDNADLAKKYADSGLFYSKRTKSPALIGKAYMYEGWRYQDLSQFRKANEQFYKSLAYLKKAGDMQGIADAYGNLGNSYLDMHEYRKSLDYQLLSLDQNEKIIRTKPKGNTLQTALMGRTYALHNIGEIYVEIGLFEKALEYERRSLGYEMEYGSEEGVAISYNTLGQTYKKKGDLDSSLFYFKKAIVLYESGRFTSPYSYAIALHEYAVLPNSGLAPKKIKEMLNKSLVIRKELYDVDGIAQIYLDVAEVEFNNLIKDSLSFLLAESYKLIQDNELDYLEEKYFKVYSKYNSRIGKYDSAYFALENYLELKAISDAKRRTHDLIAGDIKHQLETKHFNDSLLIENNFAKERSQYNERIAGIQSIVYLSIIGFIILIVTLFVIINTNRRRKRMNTILSEKNALINDQKQLVEEKNKSISDSINYAKRLQSAILPARERLQEVFPKHFLVYKPKDIVSGDFYWMEQVGDLIYFAIADCTGHGVPGAMVSVVCSNAMNRSLNEFRHRSTSEILDTTRHLIIEHFSKGGEEVADGMDVALIAVNLKSHKVTYTGAHNGLWIVANEKQFELDALALNGKALYDFKGDKQPVGYYAHANPFTQMEIQCKKGDRIYLTTDGFADQFGGEAGKKLKYLPLKRKILEIQDQEIQNQGETMLAYFLDWKGDFDQVDDLCIFGLELA
jgi:serine phosphatase RsbU (regulator of sigma subunit)/tetratricopeptide (TPR) repeat protein